MKIRNQHKAQKINPIIFAYTYADNMLKDVNGVSFNDFHAYMEEHDLRDKNFNRILYGNIFLEGFGANPAAAWAHGDDNARFHMLPSAYFNLLEYNELREVRIGSNQARWFSIIAIAVSVIAIIVSVFLATITQQVRVDKAQIIEIFHSIRLTETSTSLP